MRSKLLVIIGLLFLAILGVIIIVAVSQQPKVAKPEMKIESGAFANNSPIPAKYTCDGANINPPLKIADVGSNALSLVLIVDDPDAPGGTWVHWVVWNIAAAKTAEIAEGSVPTGAVEGVTSFGKPGYGGPCPPSSTHRYFFKLYALDTKLSLDADSDKAQVEAAMAGHILARSELIGLYSRQSP